MPTLELMKPDQLSAVDLPRDATLQELKRLALRVHLETRQSADTQMSNCKYRVTQEEVISITEQHVRESGQITLLIESNLNRLAA